MRCTVEPHPTKPGHWMLIDPRMSAGVRIVFATRARAERFAATRNAYR